MNTPNDSAFLLLGCVPDRIEAEWDPRFAHLAGFPLNLAYAGTHGEAAVVLCTYWFDPGTYAEDGDRREMWYRPRHASPYRVCVVYDQRRSRWETTKYRGDEVVSLADGRSFEQAMMQTTLVGLRPDEPSDAGR